MNIFDEIELQDCPVCGAPGALEEENGWCVYVECLDCGAHTASVEYRTTDERADAAKRAAMVWNMGKVVSSNPGE